MNKFLSFLISLTIISCSTPDIERGELEDFIRNFEGSFTNEAQYRKDLSDIAVELVNIHFWKKDANLLWFYTQQHTLENHDQAFNQRIISIERDSNNLFQVNFYFVDGFHLYGIHSKHKKDLDEIEQSDLIHQKGCSFNMIREDGEWKIISNHKECISSLNKAEYTKVDIIVRSTGIEDWTRGIDRNGVQVWGPKHAYHFKRKSR